MNSITQMQVGRIAISKLCALLIIGAMALPCYARSLAEIKKTKEIRVCIAQNDPMFSVVEPAHCHENCKFAGLVYEEAKAFVLGLGNGVRGKYLVVEWDEMFLNKEGKTDREGTYTPELLASGKCDLYATNMTKNAWRQKKLDIVTLYSGRMMVIASKAMQGKIKTASALAGKSAAIEKDTSYHTWLQEQNQSTWAASPVIIKLMPSQESVMAVDAGEVDFTLVDSEIAIWITRKQLRNAKAVFPVGPMEELGWAFRKDDKDLQAVVQKFFAKQKESDASAFNQIWERYFGISLNKFISVINSTR